MPGKLVATVLGTPDPPVLAAFYRDLLDWEITSSEPQWARLRHPDDDRPGLSFQLERDHTWPVWPQHPGTQQMQAHLDIEVDDLAAAVAVATEAGATVAEFQPQDDVRVCLDPAGHPFCLWVR